MSFYFFLLFLGLADEAALRQETLHFLFRCMKLFKTVEYGRVKYSAEKVYPRKEKYKTGTTKKFLLIKFESELEELYFRP